MDEKRAFRGLPRLRRIQNAVRRSAKGRRPNCEEEEEE